MNHKISKKEEIVSRKDTVIMQPQPLNTPSLLTNLRLFSKLNSHASFACLIQKGGKIVEVDKLEKLSCWLCNTEFSSSLDLMLHTIAEHKPGSLLIRSPKIERTN